MRTIDAEVDYLKIFVCPFFDVRSCWIPSQSWLFDVDSVELLLLLIWRHLANYFGSQAMHGPRSMSTDVASKASLQEESANSLIPVLNALDGLKLELVLDRGAVVSRRGFFELFSRRLREIVTGGEEWVTVS